MKIVNKTRYQTRALRKLAFRVAEDELDKKHKANLTVQFIESIRGTTIDGFAGTAWQHDLQDWIDIVVPKNPKKLFETDIAHILAHEFAHIRGVSHKDMRNSPRYTWIPGWKAVVAWAQSPEFAITQKSTKKKLRPTKDMKLEAAKKKIRLWESKRKLADTKLTTFAKELSLGFNRQARSSKNTASKVSTSLSGNCIINSSRETSFPTKSVNIKSSDRS